MEGGNEMFMNLWSFQEIVWWLLCAVITTLASDDKIFRHFSITFIFFFSIPILKRPISFTINKLVDMKKSHTVLPICSTTGINSSNMEIYKTYVSPQLCPYYSVPTRSETLLRWL